MSDNKLNIGVFKGKKHKYLLRALAIYNVLLLYMFSESDIIDHTTFNYFVYYFNIGIVIIYFVLYFFIKSFEKRAPNDKSGF